LSGNGDNRHLPLPLAPNLRLYSMDNRKRNEKARAGQVE